MLLHLVMDFLPEHPDLHHPVLDNLHTLSMQDPLCRDTVHHLPDQTETDQLTERHHQQPASLKEKVVPTQADITLALDLILQAQCGYAPGLGNAGLDKGINEDLLKENLVFTFVTTRPAPINFKLCDGCELAALGSMLRSHLEQHASETGWLERDLHFGKGKHGRDTPLKKGDTCAHIDQPLEKGPWGHFENRPWKREFWKTK